MPETPSAQLLAASKAALAAWRRLYELFPVNQQIEDAEFDEFYDLKRAIERVEQGDA